MTSKKELYEKFVAYHANNPQIWEAFEEKALQAAKTRDRFGARTIMEIIRWETAVRGEGRWKVHHGMAPYYARFFMQEHPEHGQFFSTKKGLHWEDL